MGIDPKKDAEAWAKVDMSQFKEEDHMEDDKLINELRRGGYRGRGIPYDKTEEYDMRDRKPHGIPNKGPTGTRDDIEEHVKKINTKDTNPKDGVGTRKWRQFCTVSMAVIWEMGVGMLEGAMKYGRHNYRVSGVRGSVYVDSAMGHISQWWEGEDLDPDSGLSHITMALTSLAVMRDAMIQGKFIDDRPPKTDLVKIRAELQEKVEAILDKYTDPVPPYLEGDQEK